MTGEQFNLVVLHLEFHNLKSHTLLVDIVNCPAPKPPFLLQRGKTHGPPDGQQHTVPSCTSVYQVAYPWIHRGSLLACLMSHEMHFNF